MPRCKSCASVFPTQRALNHHITGSPRCFSYFDVESSRRAADGEDRVPGAPIRTLPGDVPRYPSAEPQSPPQEHYDLPNPAAAGETEAGPPLKLRRVCVHEIEDEGDVHAWSQEAFPGPVATPLEEGVTPFEDIRVEQESLMEGPHAPFQDQDEWDFVKWMMKYSSQEGIDKMLKLKIVSKRLR